jgi:hypothetical protein
MLPKSSRRIRQFCIARRKLVNADGGLNPPVTPVIGGWHISFFLQQVMKTCREELEVYADPEFHGARESTFRGTLAKLCGWGRDAEIWIQELVVIQNIDEIDRGFKT